MTVIYRDEISQEPLFGRIHDHSGDFLVLNKYENQRSDGICIVRQSDITRIAIQDSDKAEESIQTYGALHEGEVPPIDLSSLQAVLESLRKYLEATKTKIGVPQIESLELPLMFMTIWFESQQTKDHFTGRFYEADDSTVIMVRNSTALMKIQFGIPSPEPKGISLPNMQIIDPAIVTRVDAMGQMEYAHLFSYAFQMRDLADEKLRNSPGSHE